MGVIPKARHFPSRNRLISGLCSAVIIVEAASKSGSLITARDALDQGREVLAVPGHPFDARAAGCNMLLRDGAVLVRSVDDVVQVLNAAENEPAFAEPVSQVTQNISQIIPSEAIKKTAAQPTPDRKPASGNPGKAQPFSHRRRPVGPRRWRICQHPVSCAGGS